MKTEYAISNAAAIEVKKLIQEYLFQGGTGFNAALLEQALEAIDAADHILIEG